MQLTQMINVLKSAGAIMWVLVLVASSGVAQTNGQASLVLDGNIEMRNAQNHQWTLEKSGTLGTSNTVNWTVAATKDPLGLREKTLNVFGVLNVTNAGSKPALLGNLVLNLQKRSTNGAWVSAAANIADSTKEDAATSANIALATSENSTLNQAAGAGNYTVAGLSGVFVEKAGSGKLQIADSQQKGLLALAQQGGIQPGQTLTLLFTSSYDNSLLNLAAGTELRLEALVTFANAGNRGNGGAAGNNLDINGNGTVDAEEATVRTVACRMSRTLPALTDVNNAVELVDAQGNVVATGGVTVSGYQTTIGGGTGVATLANSTTHTVTSAYLGSSGSLTNCARLRSLAQLVQVQSGGVTFTFNAAQPVNLEACATVVTVRTTRLTY